MKQVARFVYQGLFKRSPTILLTAVIGAVFVEEAIDRFSTYVFVRINEGKLWEHVKHKYVNQS